jgi:endonuclease YncB( thermonuclease family)
MPEPKTTWTSRFAIVVLAGVLFFVDLDLTQAARPRTQAPAGSRPTAARPNPARPNQARPNQAKFRGRSTAKPVWVGRDTNYGPGYRRDQRSWGVGRIPPPGIGPALVVVPSGEVQHRGVPGAVVRDDPERVLVRVVRPIDSQTLLVAGDDRRWRVRLLGVDVATRGESPSGDEEAARLYLAELVEGKQVLLTYDDLVAREDAGGIAVAYVHRARDNTFVNRRMIRDGYALAATDYDHHLSAIFAGQQARAEKAKAGLWK